MGNQNLPEWHLELEGKRYGPYRLDQLQELLRSGKISPDHRVVSIHPGGRALSVRELLKSASTGGFEPPPRPAEPEDSSEQTIQSPLWRDTDPTRDLFDALQASRERKTPSRPSGAEDWAPGVENSFKGVSPQAWLIGGITLFLGATVWGINGFLNQQSPETAQNDTDSSRKDSSRTDTRSAAQSRPKLPSSAKAPAVRVPSPPPPAPPSLRSGLAPAPRSVAPPPPPPPPPPPRPEARDEERDWDRRDIRDRGRDIRDAERDRELEYDESRDDGRPVNEPFNQELPVGELPQGDLPPGELPPGEANDYIEEYPPNGDDSVAPPERPDPYSERYFGN